jgi:RNA polymerase sigma-70 factor, ECF subfamily
MPIQDPTPPDRPTADRPTELAALLSRTALGDRSAFERLYRLAAPNLYAQLTRMLKRAGWADEVLQEVFVKVWQNAGNYLSERSAPMTWMTSIARNAALDRLDRRDSGEVELSGEDAEAIFDPAPGPLELSVAKADAHRIHHCLGELSPQLRQSISLAFFQGCSHSEVAANLQQPLGTVKTWIRRGLSLLKECVSR